jgi:OOP family OmpA-OmpF porin
LSTEKQSEQQRRDDLERLRKLLLGEDQSRLNLLDKRVSEFESRAADVAEVLPDAFDRISKDPVLEAELEKPMVRSIRSAIKRDAPAFAEYLFPVMGPAIRRAVADALKSLVQRINAAMENSFSIKGLRWRMEAARSGLPFAQIVLSHTMRYAVQEAFLIARDTGLVLAHAHRDENLVLDEDAVAAMLTAIQSFIQDSLGMSSDDPLRSAELGDRTLWVINGPEAIVACVISGTPPRDLRDELMAVLESIHARYGERFDETDDALAHDDGLRVLMQQCLREEVDEEHTSGKRSKALVYWSLAIAALLVLIGWTTWQETQKRKFESQVVELFRNQPGYVVSSSRRQEGALLINGLRDPATPAPDDILAQQGLSDEGLQFQFKPFLSLEPALVLEGLRSSLGLEDSTGLEFRDRTLMVNGALQSKQADKLTRLAGAHPLINAVDLSGTKLNAEEAIQLARLQLGAPESVELTPLDGHIEVSGYSDIDWYLEQSAVSRQFGGWAVDFEPLRLELQTRLLADAEKLNESVFYFTRIDRLTEQSEEDLLAFAKQLAGLLRSSEKLNADMTITLIGQVDGTGTAEQNARTSRKRAQVVRDSLISSGIEPGRILSEYPAWVSGSENLAKRRVTVRISMEDRS